MDYSESVSVENGASATSDVAVVSYPTRAQYDAAQKAALSTYEAPLTSHESMNTDGDEEEDDDESRDALEYTKRDEFTSEVFKMEVRGLPKFFPPGQLKKLLNETMQLEVKKIKPSGQGKEHCYITFGDETSRQKAIVMLDGYVWKGKTLSTKEASATPDPLIKLLEKKASEDTFKSATAEDDKLPLAERMAKNVTPYAEMSYEDQIAKKQEAAHNVLKKLGREIAKLNPELEDFVRWHKLRRKGSICEMDPFIKSPVIDGYRNKCEFTIGTNSDNGEPTVGFRVASYKEGNVCVGPVEELKHISDTMKAVVKAFEEHVRASIHLPFDPVSHEGVWRQLLVRTSNNSDCLLAVSIHPQKLSEAELTLIKNELVHFAEGEVGVRVGVTALYCLTYGQRESGVEEEYEHLWGETHIKETLMGKTFRVSPQAFFQVNTAAAEKLYEAVGEMAEIDGTNVLLDVCCGTGTIGIALAESAFKLYGLEIVEQAVADARHNAAANELTNADFLVGNCEQTLPSIFSSINGLEIKAVIDPPRAGLPASVINTLRKHEEVSTLVYLACDPNKVHQNFHSLARPCSKQVKGQFMIPIRAVAVDMFPHTDKFELVIMWERFDENKWRRIMEGNPRPRDEAYFKRIPKLPEREVYIKEWVEKKAARDKAQGVSSGENRNQNKGSDRYGGRSGGGGGGGGYGRNDRYGNDNFSRGGRSGGGGGGGGGGYSGGYNRGGFNQDYDYEDNYNSYGKRSRFGGYNDDYGYDDNEGYAAFDPPAPAFGRGGGGGGSLFGNYRGAGGGGYGVGNYGGGMGGRGGRGGGSGGIRGGSFGGGGASTNLAAGLLGHRPGVEYGSGGFGAVGGGRLSGRLGGGGGEDSGFGGGVGLAGAAPAGLGSVGRSSFGGTDPYSAAMAGYLAGLKDAKKIAQLSRVADPTGSAFDSVDDDYNMDEDFNPYLTPRRGGGSALGGGQYGRQGRGGGGGGSGGLGGYGGSGRGGYSMF